ncbi:MAG TPA: hypothetical protein QF431_07655, partial [Acidimicrobiales bacterium]|nr:hypothetical protein [Acidimicrobiales bacterium]
MKPLRKFTLFIALLGVLSFSIATPAYALQDGTSGDDESWCLEEGGIWDGANCDWGDGGGWEDDGSWCTEEGGIWDGANCDWGDGGGW